MDILGQQYRDMKFSYRPIPNCRTFSVDNFNSKQTFCNKPICLTTFVEKGASMTGQTVKAALVLSCLQLPVAVGTLWGADIIYNGNILH